VDDWKKNTRQDGETWMIRRKNHSARRGNVGYGGIIVKVLCLER